ncbi:uncharacterized protein LOC120329966 [Styela clava]
MSSFIDNILTSLNSTSGRRSEDTEMSKPCYTLFIHNENDTLSDLEIDDDLEEPTAFQIPVDMEWNDLQDLIVTEVKSPTKLKFTYRDDENDSIRIDSQDEYQTALSLCRKMHRDLHIYAVKPDSRQQSSHRQHHKRKSEELNRTQDPDEDKSEEEVEIFRPPAQDVEEREPTVIERIPTPEPTVISDPAITPPEELGATSAPQEKDEEPFETPISSVETNPEDLESQETKPMPAGNSIINIIRKEVREVVATELDDIWRFVNALKRDINNELDVIGEQLNAQGHQQVQLQQNATEDVQTEGNQEYGSLQESDLKDGEEGSKEDETDKFAATFICESLLDGSIVHTCESFEKHWVFRNDGTSVWDENTKLHLLDETCDPPVATGSSLSEWGAKTKSVHVPALKQGESGVLCAEHVSPAHGCNYNSSWRLSHNNNPFGPRVWCNVRVVDETASPTDTHTFDSAKNLGSYEMVVDDQSQKKSLEQSETESLGQSLVPPEKVSIELGSLKHDDGLHNDNSIRSFDMHDISDGAKYIETTGQESASYNPAVTSVENKEEESLHGEQKEESQHDSFKQDENEGASVDSEGTSSPVMVSPNPEVEACHEMEAPAFTHDAMKENEEPRTLENEDSEAEEDLYSSKIVINDDAELRDENHVENFTEPPMRMHDPDSSSDENEEPEEEEEEEQQEEEQHVEEPEVKVRHDSENEDLHSVDFNLVDDNMSMTSYDVSDFVVVPLPDCFDVNRPLNVSEHEDVEKEGRPVLKEPEQQSITSEQAQSDEELNEENEDFQGQAKVKEEEKEPAMPPSDDETSDSEIESQPASATYVKEYRSEDSLPIAPRSPPSGRNTPPTAPKSNPPPVVAQPPKVNLAPTFVPPENDPTSDPEDSMGPDSVDNESLTERITKDFNAFLMNPVHPIEPQPTPKIPMNQMATKVAPAPKPVPQSVLNQDQPYNFGPQEPPYFLPFEQGWRRNPIPVPRSVNDATPWQNPIPQLPRSEFTLNRNSNGIESTLPGLPFAVASPSESLTSDDPMAHDLQPARLRAPSPQIELADDFYPPGDGDEDIFRTPPPSPPPRQQAANRDDPFELSPLDQLFEMGFHDLDLNRNIFEQCGHDLNRTVQALVLRQEADNDMME